jgi:hypothetical protein
MSSITGSVSDNIIKLDYFDSPISNVIQPYTNTHKDIDTKSVSSRASKLTYSGKKYQRF